MKKLILICTFVLAGCDHNYHPIFSGPPADGHSSLVSMLRVSTGATACGSGSGVMLNEGLDLNDNGVLEPSEIKDTQIICDGQNGATGAVGNTGASGTNGHNTVFNITSAPGCAAGGSTVLMALDTNDNGVLDNTDTNLQVAVLCNGVAGTNGTNGQNGHDGVTPAFTPVEPILPCGNTVAYKEVLLRLSNGQVLASFSDDVQGDMTRLAFLPDGTFMDTDNSSCTFSLSTSGTTRSISWLGSVQETWQMTP